MQEGLRSDESRFGEIERLGRVDLKTELELFDIVHTFGGEGHGDLLAGAGGGKFAFFDANALYVAAVEIGGELKRTRLGGIGQGQGATARCFGVFAGVGAAGGEDGRQVNRGRTTRSQLDQALGQASALGCGVLLASCGAGPSNGGFESAIFSEVRVIGSRGNAPGQFVKPRSVAVDRDDNVYVCDMTGRVQKFDAQSNYLLQWQMPEIERGRPKGMALDHEGNIVVVEPHYSRINHFTPEGRLVSQWGRHGR